VNEERVKPRVRLGRNDARKKKAAQTQTVERDESEQQPLPQRRSSGRNRDIRFQRMFTFGFTCKVAATENNSKRTAH
jgi:hypothetical protein